MKNIDTTQKESQSEKPEVKDESHYDPSLFIKAIERLDLNITSMNSREFSWLEDFLNEKPQKFGELEELAKSGGEQAVDRVRAFLFFEKVDDSGSEVIEIANILHKHPELSTSLFARYADVIGRVAINAEKIEKMYDSLILNDPLNKKGIRITIYVRAQNFLRNVLLELKNCPDEKQAEVVTGAIKESESQEKIQERALKQMTDLFKMTTEKSNKHTTSSEQVKTENIVNLDSYSRKEKAVDQISFLRDLADIRKEIRLQFQKFVYGELMKEGSDRKEESVDLVFQKYQELIAEAKNITQNIREIFREEKGFSDEDVTQIVDTVLQRAKDLVSNYIEKVKNSSSQNKEETIEQLEGQKTDAVTFASIFKIANKKEKLSFDELKGVDYETIISTNLSEDEKIMIRKTVKLNYPNPKQQEEILLKIEDSFADQKTKWHLLTKQGSGDKKEMIACIRFDEIDESTVYAASFNVGLAFRGSSLGEAMFDRVMTDTAKEKRIQAIGEIGKPISDFYVNKGGFNVTGVRTNEKTGINYYGIERFDPENEFYGTKRLGDEALLSYYKPKAQISDLIKTQHYILIKKEVEDATQNFAELDYVLNEGYLLTKIIKGKDNSASFFVFEKRISGIEEQYDLAA